MGACGALEVSQGPEHCVEWCRGIVNRIDYLFDFWNDYFEIDDMFYTSFHLRFDFSFKPKNVRIGDLGAGRTVNVSVEVEGPQGVAAADIDGDGDMDLFSASMDSGEVRWHENDGNHNFTDHVISNSTAFPSYIFPSDLNGDGKRSVKSPRGLVSELVRARAPLPSARARAPRRPRRFRPGLLRRATARGSSR